MNNQVYDMIQARLKRICASEYEQAPKTRKGKLKSPLQYSETVEQLIELSSAVLDMSAKDAEHVCYEITHGSIQDAFLRANPNA
tara:strand:+ start:9211 stop:9462 length:252 start_codon:yes stop_codon:yes gene_type:complete